MRRHHDDMSYDELEAIGQLLFGRRWKRPLARAVDIDNTMFSKFEDGTRRVTPDVASRIRSLADIGVAGTTIRAAIKETIVNIPPFAAHEAARKAVNDLREAGLLKDQGASDS